MFPRLLVGVCFLWRKTTEGGLLKRWDLVKFTVRHNRFILQEDLYEGLWLEFHFGHSLNTALDTFSYLMKAGQHVQRAAYCLGVQETSFQWMAMCETFPNYSTCNEGRVLLLYTSSQVDTRQFHICNFRSPNHVSSGSSIQVTNLAYKPISNLSDPQRCISLHVRLHHSVLVLKLNWIGIEGFY
ncbi:hypothetical protein CEXT_79631 [Caerostris extrusa]|uniref:Uncharacterized protein n=1 Tax=Caerostris extrusa TaxID=172846 RepID=A0AAV4UX53_CAEEX|nr:hypothetical protein CEXT_79631 [Caerostris extrusa]